MKRSKLFAIEMQIKPMADSGLEEVNGAIVTLYIPSSGMEAAIAETRVFMTEEPYELVELRCAALIDISDWEDDADSELSKNDLSEILDTGEAKFGPFYAF